MGLFGDDSSFTSVGGPGTQNGTLISGGDVPRGFHEIFGPADTGYYSGPNRADLNGPNGGPAITYGAVNQLTGPGTDVNGHVVNASDPNSYSYNNLDLIAKNQQSLLAGNNLPFEQQAFQRSYLNNPNTVQSDPSQYLMGGDPNYARNAAATLGYQAAAAQSREAPQINSGATNMIMGGAGNALNQANSTGFAQLGNAYNMAGTANGAGYQGQLASAQNQTGNAQGLQTLAGQIGQGPSAAELAMRQAGDRGLQQQAALAAGARGGNASLALRNAAANSGNMTGALEQNVGIQRANEVATNNAQKIQALSASNQGFGAAGQTYGSAASTQQGAYQGAGQQLGQIAGQQLGAANTQVNVGQTYADLAKAQAQLGLGTMSQNDQATIQSQQLANQYMQQQLQGTVNYDQNRTQNQANILTNQYANRDKSGEGTITGSGGGDKALGAGLSAVGTAMSISDIRAKKDIAPAQEAVSDVYRLPSAPAYSYFYKNPNSPGAAPGQHFGPMAQDLEKTPAGASVVGEKNGKKTIDTDRLSLLNTSELSKQRQELDALTRSLDATAPIGPQTRRVVNGQALSPGIVYPWAQSMPGASPAQVPDLTAANAQADQIRSTQVAYPQPQPYRLGGV